ncbi:hypothetical protein [Gilliamella sp. wkB112]|uniref:hypothetical protein n=1 Tax=Gilliamella sp. wkB112 TaxID=3120257 RepID=UPI00080E48E2|nr:hypothetical protein [Gilliamella apicola]OCG01133.1 hypothetical protein A9G12_00840 [Gilliamella apicola]
MQNYYRNQHLYVLNPLKNTLFRLLHSRVIISLNYLDLLRLLQLYYLTLNRLSKLPLVLVFLLPYSVNTQALSATTVQVINGSQPYLTFDGGVTKATDINSLLAIKLSDGTTITPATNTSTVDNPIELPEENQSMADISMLVPPTITDSITLNDLIRAPYNYWGDDDGDGDGANGITASGSLSISITDKENQVVSRNTTLDICQAPYKVVLTSTAGSLTTQYGLPNSSNFTGNSATYYINPKADPVICYVRPHVTALDGGDPTTWHPKKGYLVQSTTLSSYERNFPTTGMDSLHFDLLISNNTGPLTWPTVTQGGITATMTLNPPVERGYNPDGASSVRVTLTGPVATEAQSNSNSPNRLSAISLPQTFELVGYDSNHRAVVKYGFVLKQWFVIREEKLANFEVQSSWCASIGNYRIPKIKELTNATCEDPQNPEKCVGVESGTPSSGTYLAKYTIGAGFVSEWGRVDDDLEFYWTDHHVPNTTFDHLTVWLGGGLIQPTYTLYHNRAICVYP